MSTNTVDRLHVAVLDGHLMDDATLARLVPECRSLTAFTTGADQSGLELRWAAIAPGTELIDGGQVADLRQAMVECAKRRIVVISTGVPADPASFVAHALQGAAAMTEYDVPGVAVHVMRPDVRQGSVAWLTDTGELSGYGVLFAVGYAHLHSASVDLIEPSSGLGRPRTADALDDALAFAEAAGVPVTRHTDPSPFARVLRDEHCMVVHPVLDAPKGFNLLHPGELSRKAVASGNPAVVVELLEQFPGDVVAVFDGVHLLQGSIPAARIAAGVALGVVAAAGIGTMAASPAMASTVSQSVRSGVVATVSGQNGMGHSGIAHVENSLDHAVTVTLRVTWGATSTHGNGEHGEHDGQGKNQNHPDLHTEVSNVVLQPGQSLNVQIPRPSGNGHGSYHPIRVDPQVTSHHQVVDEGTLTVMHAQGPGALVDEKDPTTELQPNAPHIDVLPPQVTGTESPSFTVTGQPVLNEVPPLQGTPMSVPNRQVPGPGVQGPVVTPPIPQPPLEAQGPVVTPPLQGPGVQGPVVTPPIPQPPLEAQGPVVTPPLQGPGVQGPVVTPPIPQPPLEAQGPVVTPPLQGPGVQGPVVTPPIPQPPLEAQGPVVTPPLQGPGVQGPVVTPPIPQPPLEAQGPVVTPGPGQKVDAPELPPPLPDEGTPVSVPNPQAPGAEEKLEAPSLLPPPVRGQVDEYIQSSIPAVVTSVVAPQGSVVTPDVPVDVGSSVVTPAVTTEGPTTEVAPTVSVTTVPGDVSTSTTTPQQAGTPHHATHHASHPGHVTTTVVDGDQAPAGELAHTGGNTAILAIVAGSLLAAGAGLAAAGRMGKDDPDTGATEG